MNAYPVNNHGLRELQDEDRTAVLNYVQDEAAYNLFIIGDVENYGFNDENVSIAVCEQNGKWDSLVLRYHDNCIVYAKQDTYNAEAIADYIKSQRYETISGKGSLIEKLIPFFPNRKPRKMILSRCNQLRTTDISLHDAVVRQIEPFETDKVVRLYCLIDEFKHQYIGSENEQAVRMAKEMQKGSIGVGAYIDDELVSCAQISARSSIGAMIIGVATHPHYRRRGLASAVMQALCKASFGMGLSFLCLFYDNPQAGRIYRRIGFVEMGEYAMLSPSADGEKAQ